MIPDICLYTNVGLILQYSCKIRDLNTIAKNAFSASLYIILVFIFFFAVLGEKTQPIVTNAQIVPLPSPIQRPLGQPAKNTSNDIITNASRLDCSPTAKFLTNSLIEGKNVVKVKIIDKCWILRGELKYVQNRQIVTTDLIRDPNEVYKALVDVRGPSALIVLDALDIKGKQASAAKDFNVNSDPYSVFNKISHFFYETGKTIVSTFTKPKS